MADVAGTRELNRTWTTSTAGKLAQSEFAFQRMHRDPIHIGPPDMGVNDRSVYRSSYPERSERSYPANVGARYTLGTKNDLGTQIKYHTVDLNTRQLGQVHLSGTEERVWTSEFQQHFAPPNLTHPTQGTSAPRGGKAPRMPFSEVERRFGSLDSAGTMPGKDGKTEGTSEARAKYADPGRQPALECVMTLGYANDIGSSTRFQKTPAILKDMTHYSLGNVPSSFVTTAMDAAAPPPPPAERTKRLAAGQQPPVGPSEVEQGFRTKFTSRDFNIITGGTRLHGGLNAENYLAERNSKAHERPVGQKQHPNVNPADRGPSGVRQSFDIITGVERPRERW